MTAKEAIKVILEDEAHHNTSLNYAVAYAQEIERAQENLNHLYLRVLCNISHWRHPQAMEVRAALKKEGVIDCEVCEHTKKNFT